MKGQLFCWVLSCCNHVDVHARMIRDAAKHGDTVRIRELLPDKDANNKLVVNLLSVVSICYYCFIFYYV